eukprot:GILI01010177.1.p1 GENE.GILI01010177.1~~GILI01010177.1.p1  ORF type:complete len:256 (+),score=47.01 GILI01010177.1:61-768(+)
MKKAKFLDRTDKDLALFKAAQEGNMEELKTIFHLDSKEKHRDPIVDVNMINHLAQTPLTVACASSIYCVEPEVPSMHFNIVLLLLNQGANVNVVDSFGSTPLHYACHQGAFDVAILLVQAKARINVANKSGHTPLHKACMSGNVLLVRFLLDYGADKDAVTHANWTPLMWAARHNHLGVATQLLSYEASTKVQSVDGLYAVQLCQPKSDLFYVLSGPEFAPEPSMVVLPDEYYQH